MLRKYGGGITLVPTAESPAMNVERRALAISKTVTPSPSSPLSPSAMGARTSPGPPPDRAPMRTVPTESIRDRAPRARTHVSRFAIATSCTGSNTHAAAGTATHRMVSITAGSAACDAYAASVIAPAGLACCSGSALRQATKAMRGRPTMIFHQPGTARASASQRTTREITIWIPEAYRQMWVRRSRQTEGVHSAVNGFANAAGTATVAAATPKTTRMRYMLSCERLIELIAPRQRPQTSL